MDERMRKKLREFEAKIVTRFDQQLQEFRLAVASAPPEEHQRMRQWLQEAAVLEERTGPGWQLRLKVHVNHSYRDQDGEPVYEGSAELNPKVMLRALDAWENGEEFTPKGAFGTC